jgi:hypothetical protein
MQDIPPNIDADPLVNSRSYAERLEYFRERVDNSFARSDQFIFVGPGCGLKVVRGALHLQQGKRPIVRKGAYGNGKIELKRLEQEHTNKLLAEGAKLFNQRASDSSYRLARYVTIEKLED